MLKPNFKEADGLGMSQCFAKKQKPNSQCRVGKLNFAVCWELYACKIASGQLWKSSEIFGGLFCHFLQFLQKRLICKALLAKVAKQSIW